MKCYEVGIGSEFAIVTGVIRQTGVSLACIWIDHSSAHRRTMALAANTVSKAIRSGCDCKTSHDDGDDSNESGQ